MNTTFIATLPYAVQEKIREKVKAALEAQGAYSARNLRLAMDSRACDVEPLADITAELETARLIAEVDKALEQHGTDVISVDYNAETGMVDINECHHSWSDCICGGIVRLDAIVPDALIRELDKRNVGHCGI